MGENGKTSQGELQAFSEFLHIRLSSVRWSRHSHKRVFLSGSRLDTVGILDSRILHNRPSDSLALRAWNRTKRTVRGLVEADFRGIRVIWELVIEGLLPIFENGFKRLSGGNIPPRLKLLWSKVKRLLNRRKRIQIRYWNRNAGRT